MSLLELPLEVLHYLCSTFLCPRSVAHLSETCSHLHWLLSQDDRVWILLARHKYKLELKSKSSKAIVLGLLNSMLYENQTDRRLWVRKNFGALSGLYQIVYRDERLDLVHWQPPFDPDVFAPLKPVVVAKISIDEANMERRAKLVLSGREVQAKLVLPKKKKSQEVNMFDCSTCQWGLSFDSDSHHDFYVDMLTEQMSRYPIPAQSLEYGIFSLNNIKSYVFGYYNDNNNHVTVEEDDEKESNSDPWCLQMFEPYHLRPFKKSAKLPITPGLFKGTYGFHGIELIEISVDDRNQDEFRGVKVTGDPNVPAGSVSFRAKLKHAMRLETEDEQRSFDQLRQLCVDVDTDDRIVGFDQVSEKSQPFAVPSNCHLRCVLSERTCLYRFVCECQVAHMGYINPEFIMGHLVVFNDDLFAVLFLQIQSMSVFHRVNSNCFDT